MTLTEFLLARIAEDQHFGTHDRALAKRWDSECKAKRRIVEELGWQYDDVTSGGSTIRAVLALLALPYAGHPDYRDEWKP